MDPGDDLDKRSRDGNGADVTLISLDEIRAIREQRRRDERHGTDPMFVDERLLELIRAYVAKLQGVEEVNELVKAPPGPCDDCLIDEDDDEHHFRFEYGQFTVCRAHVISRIKALHKAASQEPLPSDGVTA